MPNQAVSLGDRLQARLDAAGRGVPDWLSLAAAPTFAIMALHAAMPGGATPDICSAAHHASPLSGMVPMYLLMSAFHSAPWLKLASRRRRQAPLDNVHN